MEFTKDELQRFKARVAKKGESDCWEWTGSKFDTGYGLFCLRRGKRKSFMAHRVSWAMHNNQDIPSGMVICHTCDNRSCVNPRHLYLGSSRDNNLDTVRRGRGNRKVGEACSWSKVTESQVMEILRSDYGPGANAEFARRFGVTQSQISHIRSGKRWPHLKARLNG